MLRLPAISFAALGSAVALACCSLAAQAASPLVQGDAAAGKQLAASTCAACHGADGNSVAPTFPRLAGQSPVYIVQQLKAYKSGARSNPIMQPQAAGLSEKDMRNVAAWYASQKPGFGAANPKVVEAGHTLYMGGDLQAGIPACAGCHGPAGAGMPSAGYPRIGGQHAQYVAAQLNAFKNGSRTSVPMNAIAEMLSDKDIQALSSYIQGLH